MSFRAKLSLCVLLLVTIMLDACLLLMVRKGTELNLARERARALGAHYQLIQAASSQLGSLPQNADALNTLPLVHNQLVRAQTGMDLFWYVGGDPALGGAPMPVPTDLLEGDGLRRTVISGEWLLAASSLPAPNTHISLVSATSLLPLIEMNRQISEQMLIMALIASIFLLGLSWLLLTRLLAPMTRLSKAMRLAMGGNFSARVRASGKGELAQLSLGFNRMAHTTQRHIAELSESAERNQRFADNLAHEMRTPVTAIGGYARSLLMQPLDEPDRRKALHYIATESARMQKMSEALLALAGLRQVDVHFEPTPVRRLLEHAAQATSAELSEKGLRLAISCQQGSLTCDPTLIESLLINLIVNSARASEPGQSIELFAGLRGSAPYLEVTDHGCGMTDEQAARATEAFYRTDKARARRHGGAGLGLALARQIADVHGATLTIDSAPGRGTKVRVEFTTRLQPGEDAET